MTITELVPAVQKLSQKDKLLLVKVIVEMVESENFPTQTNTNSDTETDKSEITEEEELDLAEQIAFMNKPIEEQNRIFAEQAETMRPYYEQNAEWKEWLAGDIVEY
ncbi:MAG: hypothetical protein AAFY72_10440 [Cyanobacteria bacterium J06649_4]